MKSADLNGMKKLFFCFVTISAALYILVCGLLFFFQEYLIFVPAKLGADYVFDLPGHPEEINIKTEDSVLLNGLLFRADSSKGVILYLHGNGGSLASWGNVAEVYTDNGYDLFMPDYRGYGKSGGEITGSEQLFSDVQTVYDELKKSYSEDNIVVLGYSIGTGMAAKVAADNHPRLLILQAPYYSLSDIARERFPLLPSFLLRYKLNTYQYLERCRMPVVIFHGDADEVISHYASLKLKKLLKPEDRVVILEGLGHNGMLDDQRYRAVLAALLTQ